MPMMIAAFLLLWTTLPSALAWQECDGGGMCPDHNTCCPTLVPGRASCITGKHENTGKCCTFAGTSGCAEDFDCAVDHGVPFCHNLNRTDLPSRLPRYRPCWLPEEALTRVYGLPVVPQDPEVPHLAYMSTMGALDSSEMVLEQSRVETIVLMVHGSGRNVEDYLCSTNAALPANHQDPSSSKMMALAPWFLSNEDAPGIRLYNSTARPLRWSEYGPIFHTWRYGADADNQVLSDKDVSISSYDVMDRMLEYILEHKEQRFANLKRIVVAGHSAGGQYTQRWALLSSSPSFTYEQFHLRVIVANPRSLCWLDDRRMVNGTLRVPPQAEEECPLYNEWEWGLGPGEFLDTPYKSRAFQTTGVDRIVERYAERDVIYLAGEEDTIPNGECQDKMQGDFRKERSANFFAALPQIYGRPVHKRLVAQGVPHDHSLLFQSPEGQQALFGLQEETPSAFEAVE